MVKWLLGLLALCAVIFAFFGGIWMNADKIRDAEREMLKMRYTRDSLKVEVRLRDSLQTHLKTEVKTFKEKAELLRTQVTLLEETRAAAQLSVRRLRKPEALRKKLMDTFPEMARSNWGVTKILNEENNIRLDYLMVPLWFSETFIIDHQNAISYLAQRDSLIKVDSLQTIVVGLQDSIYTLENLNRQAYEKGYNVAFFKYDSLNSAYIKELRRGKIDWGWQAAGIVGGGILGYIIGR